MKKVYLALLAAGFMGLVACGGAKTEEAAPADSTATATEAPAEEVAAADSSVAMPDSAAASTEAAK